MADPNQDNPPDSPKFQKVLFGTQSDGTLIALLADSSGKLETTATGGTAGQLYTEGNTDATITGRALMWEDAADTLRAVSAAKPLPVTFTGGTAGQLYTEGDTDATITGRALMWEDSADTLRAVSSAKPLPVSFTGDVTVVATDLDIRDLVKTQDEVYAVLRTDAGVAYDARTRSWTLASGTDNVSAVQSGTWTVNIGTFPDNEPFNLNQFGGTSVTLGQKVKDSSIPIVIASDQTWIGATNLAKAEDTVHASGDVGVMSLGVRADDPSTVAAEGDYTPLLTSDVGGLWIENVPNEVNAGNSTTSTLIASAVFTGTGLDVLHFDIITITLDASHDSATDGMTFQFSTDNTNWDDVYNFTYTAADGARRFQFPVTSQFFRVVYTNGGTGQTHFRLQTILHHNNTLTTIHRLVDNVSNDRSAQIMKAAIIAQQGGGGPGAGDFIPIQATAGGNLRISVQEVSDGLDIGPGNANTETQRVSISTDDVNLSAIKTSTNNTDTNTSDIPNVIGTDGGVGPSKVLSIGGTESGGNIQELRVDSDGHLQIDVLTSALPSGAATESTLSGLLTESTFTTRINTQGQKTMAASTPVVLSSNQSVIPVSQSGTWNINNISGTISLPTGAATSAKQLVDGHNVTIDNASGASAVNIQDGGNSITVDGSVTANAGTNLNTSLLATEATLASIKDTAGIKKITDNINIGDISKGTQTNDVKITLDGELVDVSSRAARDLGKVDIAGFDVSLPTGSNTIGKLAANSGVDIGDVDVTSTPKSGTGTHSSINVTTSSTTVLASNTNRLGLLIKNNGTQTVFLNFGTTAVLTNFPLESGENYVDDGDSRFTGVINGIVASSTLNLRVVEFT